ncbi:benzodiazapine receptor [Catalinimonas alkaloidigena]|uniref:hypothetical protein n=1 Tax=Catalinimonas alkaloidigena TaxID=1075417 RepID=UPI002406829D|nr:hypothetical protein [Catalinimonas alkaloidigena]MDF9797431.1 benzodiazapine receptor [Catalinimonas alkaloidigena]
MNQLSKVSKIRWLVILFFLLTIITNYIAQVNPFNGQTNGEVSAKYSTLITPAAYAFSIWGVIFLALGIYVFYQAMWAPVELKVFNHMAKWLIASFITTSLWLPAFQYELLLLSLIIMFLILFSLIRISSILVKDKTISGSWRIWLKIPFGLFLGWIAVATIVNTTVVIKYAVVSIGSIDEQMWLWITLALGFILAILISKWSRNASISLVFAWAYFAIGKNESQTEDSLILATTGAIMLLLISIFFMYSFYKSSENVGFKGA